MKENTAKLVGNRIKLLRVRKNVSQEELSFKSDLHRTYIGAIERGEKCPTIETILKITQAFEISLSDFFSDLESEINDIEG